MSKIQIPKFQNKIQKPLNIFLYELTIKNNLWQIKKINNCENNENFFILKEGFIDNEKIFSFHKKKSGFFIY